MIPTDTIDMLEATWASITDVCSSLTAAEWKAPTDLPGWSVQDNLAHLIGTERHLQGLPPTEHRAERPTYARNQMGETNEHEVDARRSLDGAEVLAEWKALVAERTATLRSADDAYFDAPAWTPVGEGTVGSFLSIRVLDNWLHEQDIRRAIGRPGHLGGPAAEHTIDRLLLTIPIVIGKRAETPDGGAVVLDITGEVQRHVVTEVQGGRAKVVEAPSAEPLAGLEMGTETFVVLAAGRRDAANAGEVVCTGDRALAERVLTNMDMMI